MPRDTARPVSVPGAESAALEPVGGGEVERLQAMVAQQAAQIQALLAAVQGQHKQAAASPGASILYEQETPHGREKMAESPFRHMTTAEMTAAVKSGEINLGGKPYALCKDGYFCDPSYR